jgi:hypothetical protein
MTTGQLGIILMQAKKQIKLKLLPLTQNPAKKNRWLTATVKS